MKHVILLFAILPFEIIFVGIWKTVLIASLMVWFYVAVLLHELGHLMAARVRGFRCDEVHIGALFGWTSFDVDKTFSNIDEMIISITGPMINILIGVISFLPIFLFHPSTTVCDILWASAIINLSLGLVNLVPVFPSDGAYFLRGLIDQIIHSSVIANITSVILSAGIVIAGIVYMFAVSFNLIVLMCVIVGGVGTLYFFYESAKTQFNLSSILGG